MSTLVAPRSRAAARVNRISVDLDRSSGYLLGKVYWNLDELGFRIEDLVSFQLLLIFW